MSKIKYRYAFDENDNLVCIEDVIKEECRKHTYHCIGCGCDLLPRLGNVRNHHFYHGKAKCDSESYIHKLAKWRLVEKFNNSEHFYVSYNVIYVCSKADCTLRNVNCCQPKSQYKIDLKQYYNTAQLESPIKGFVADVLLTNSVKEVEPVLLEVYVTHSCEQKKLDSHMRIIELQICNESDANGLINRDVLQEESKEKDKRVSFYNFKTKIPKKMSSEIHRFVRNDIKQVGYEEIIKCEDADSKIDPSSTLEINAVCKKQNVPRWSQYVPWEWGNKRKTENDQLNVTRIKEILNESDNDYIYVEEVKNN